MREGRGTHSVVSTGNGPQDALPSAARWLRIRKIRPGGRLAAFDPFMESGPVKQDRGQASKTAGRDQDGFPAPPVPVRVSNSLLAGDGLEISVRGYANIPFLLSDRSKASGAPSSSRSILPLGILTGTG